jgi:5-amino-6-(5-phosphoribosylamino)uracil reductase
MADRPYTLLSCGVSLDGYLDSPTVSRLRLSNDADFDRVDAVRASCDAILVGANTVRNDNPRLLIRAAERRRERIQRGWEPDPLKVTVTRRGDLDPRSAFFSTGAGEKLVYCPASSVATVRRRLGHVATVVDAGREFDLRYVCRDLSDRGVQRLIVEGGNAMHTQFLTGELADQLDLVVAPIFVGDSRAHRFVGDGNFPWCPERRAPLAEVQQIGDVVLLRYALSSRFETG